MLQKVYKITGIKTGRQYYKTLRPFTDFISSNNIDVFRELLANNTILYTLHQAILKFSERYYQTILIYSELISNNIHTSELLPNNSKCFFENLNGHLNRQKTLKQKILKQK